jgi:hypothetical protein
MMDESQFGNGQNQRTKVPAEVEEEVVEEDIAAGAVIKVIKEEDFNRQTEVIKNSFYLF